MRLQTIPAQVVLLLLMVLLIVPVAGCSDGVPETQPAIAKVPEGPGFGSAGGPVSPPEPRSTEPISPTVTPTSTPQPTPTPTSTPTSLPSPTPRPALPLKLEIPAIGVNAFVEHVGLTEDLAMDVPARVEDVAWYKLGYRPGERGHAVFAGHLDTVTGAPAVFWDLEALQSGDDIFVTGLDGKRQHFVVDYHTRYPYDEAPVQSIFGPASKPTLALVTCKGDWDRANRNYSHRVVLYATAADDGANE